MAVWRAICNGIITEQRSIEERDEDILGYRLIEFAMCVCLSLSDVCWLLLSAVSLSVGCLLPLFGRDYCGLTRCSKARREKKQS